MAEARRTSRTRKQTEPYNPSAHVEKRRTPRNATKKAKIDHLAEIQTVIGLGDELYDEEEVWTLENFDDRNVTLRALHWFFNSKWHGSEWKISPQAFASMIFGRPIPESHALTFAMVTHSRLGSASVFSCLVPDLVQRIVQLATSKVALSRVNSVPTPIPIKLVLGGDSVMSINISGKLEAPMKRAIEETLTGWKWKDSFFEGFGTITPSRISWKHIWELAIPQITDGFKPGGGLGNGSVAGFPLLNIRETCSLVETEVAVIAAYEQACQRGDKHFEMAFEHIWICADHAPCIGGDSQVLLAGGSHKLVRHLCVGDAVVVARAASSEPETAQVTATWCSRAQRSIPMVSVQGVELTPDHPVCFNSTWRLPSALARPRLLHVDAVYNFALSRGHSLLLRKAHAAGSSYAAEPSSSAYVECCTLGKDVPGMPDELWGTPRIFEAIRSLPGYPRMITAY
eukprot:CAMPEP_0181304918 /NCGR_PEP_ID=MMETSP1101-20121128/9431_1 /TAXON_ID=46948 /ORGANISM="Rhodomonas abbreviata, Strain Caron Lab Isolate" /LENGTH=455 /DNA_ID=CAMNT_0023410757 /DNA_START=1 /DNA_END=1368 /DNA_ORIENTATION=+